MNALFQWEQLGQVRHLDPEHGTTGNGLCNQTNAVILAGTGVTDGAGRWALTLDATTMCLPLDGADWVSLVATPCRQGEAVPLGPPPVITAAWDFNPTGFLILRIQTRDGHGHDMIDIPFAWHAVILRHLG
ncbi:MAG TPA: hypothetical protein VKM72_04120 [Thermoanaerobaculia bacterium]|nr:hypothetical protein [Thermoanaerobaculia bacterium]